MDVTTLSLLMIGIIAMLSACGSLITRDNLYSALYMSITLILAAAAYAVFGISPVLILIVLIFVGAIGAVTVVLASTHRYITPEISVAGPVWGIPAIVTMFIIGFVIFIRVPYDIRISYDWTAILDSFASEYVILTTFVVTLIVIMVMALVKFVRREGV